MQEENFSGRKTLLPASRCAGGFGVDTLQVRHKAISMRSEGIKKIGNQSTFFLHPNAIQFPVLNGFVSIDKQHHIALCIRAAL